VKPGTLAVIRILAATSVRRYWNRVGAMFRKRKQGRDATARKGGRSTVVLAIAGLLFLSQAFFLSYQFTLTVSQAVEKRDGVEKAPKKDSTALPEGVDIPEPLPWGARAWPATAPPDAAVRCYALMLTLLVLALVFIGIGTGQAELSQVGWSMEWLFGFPVPARTLLVAKAGEYALTAVFAWLTLFPLTSVMLWNGGWGVWGAFGGAAVTFLAASAIGSVRVLVETFLRKRFALTTVKNVQATCTLAGMLLFFVAIAFVMRSVHTEFLLAVSDAVGTALLLGPAGAAVGALLHPAFGALFVVWIACIGFACLRAAERLVSTGLLSAGGPYQGTRAAARPSRPIGGILSKDFRLLLRDRNLLVQTLVVPLLIVGFQFVINPSFGAASEPRLVAALAYGIAAYVVAFGGLRVLVSEQNALWLLYSLPPRLDRMLRKKAVVWGVVGACYALAVLAYRWRPEPGMEVEQWISPLFAVGGVFLCAFLAGAMGTMGFDPFERELSHKISNEWSMLYMGVAGIFGLGLARGDLWNLLQVFTLTLFLVYALWNRVQRRVPYLLDPTALPERRVEIADGLIAAFLFLFVQVLAFAAARAGGTGPALAIALSFGVAGVVTVLLSSYALWRFGVRGLVEDLGIRVPRPGPVALGVAAGGALGAMALLYLRVFDEDYFFRQAMENVAGLDATARWLLVGTMVVLAPLLEEFLYRGLLFRGFCRGMRVPYAVLGSALIFALLHPAASFPPVFALGAVAAWLLHWTGVLWAPIAAHMTYNAVVVYAQWSPSLFGAS